MSRFPATQAKRVLAALLRNGWRQKRQVGSHRVIEHNNYANFSFSFHDSDEIGPRMMERIAKVTGLRPEDS